MATAEKIPSDYSLKVTFTREEAELIASVLKNVSSPNGYLASDILRVFRGAGVDDKALKCLGNLSLTSNPESV